MKCPKCETELQCPCKHCLKRYKEKNEINVLWVWLENDIIMCGKCGYSAHCDVWMDIEAKQSEAANDKC